jgi:hypothetical protein
MAKRNQSHELAGKRLIRHDCFVFTSDCAKSPAPRIRRTVRIQYPISYIGISFPLT